jgi:Ca-activated chloride channel family protein
MRKLPLLFLAILLTGQDVVIRTSVQLVTILATVKNQRGGLVGSLGKEDFTILDEGHKQDIRIFDREAGMPLTVALLVDSSGSTAKDLRFELDSATRFLRTIIRPEDRACIFSFNQSVEQIGTFTNDVAALERHVRSIHSEGGTSLYDAIFLASEQLRHLPGRRVIVLVTDGDDTTSVVGYQQALHAAQDSDAVIYGMIVVPIPGSAGRDIGGEHAMMTLSDDTGGRAFQPRPATDLDPVFKDLAEELRTQYVLGFYAQPLTGAKPFRRLEVKTVNPAFAVQARKGYYFKDNFR